MPLEIVSRNEWGAMKSKAVEAMNRTAPFVIIHHSYLPSACNTSEQCIAAMQSMQRFHQNERGWFDVGYQWVKFSSLLESSWEWSFFKIKQNFNIFHRFAVGGDGKVYEGRGFNVVGAHAPAYNDKSIGICLIGDWQSILLVWINNVLNQKYNYIVFISILIFFRLLCWKVHFISFCKKMCFHRMKCCRPQRT